MANAKISDLTDGGAVEPSDEIPVARAGTNVRVRAMCNTLANGNIFIGSAGNVATSKAISGDATLVASGALTLANSGVTGGTYGSAAAVGSFTVDAKGRLNSASNVAIAIGPSAVALNNGNLLVGNASNVAASVTMSGDATLVASGALTLANTAVTAGTYGNGTSVASFTVDAKGRLTSASNVAISAGSLTVIGGANRVNSVTCLNFTSGVTITDAAGGEARGVVAGGGASLDAITAAAGDQAGIANADNNIRWNWAKTTNSEVAFEFGESAASTNGTSTSGVPNQYITKFSTVAASTASPAGFYSRAAHVFSVSPTSAQTLHTDGSASLPAISFASAPTSGIYMGTSNVQVTVSGTRVAMFNSQGLLVNNGTALSPSIENISGNGGLFWASGVVGVAVTDVENSRFTAGAWQVSKGTADAVSYAINARKSRGTVASPTVITTGDDLLTISGYGYVGATNTYQEATRITFDSTGTIADSATGIGGIIRFHHAIVGAEPAEVGMFRSQHLIHEGTSPTITANGGTNPTIAGKDEAFDVTIGTGGTATDFTVTFANAFTTNAPIATAQSDTDIIALKVATTTTTVTVTASTPFTAGSKVHVICRGWE